MCAKLSARAHLCAHMTSNLTNAQCVNHIWDGAGIGKSLAFKLASQKLNVVLVALNDDLLKATFAEIKDKFPDRQFRMVSCCQEVRQELQLSVHTIKVAPHTCVVATSMDACTT